MFSRIAHPLYKSLKKETEFIWDENQLLIGISKAER